MRSKQDNEIGPEDCGEVQELLLSSDRGVPERRPIAFDHHLVRCAACREAASSIESLDRLLRSGFAQLDRTIPLPSEDEITLLLRNNEPAVEARNLRTLRRSVKNLLWTVFFLLSLLGTCALLYLAYKARILGAGG